MMRVTNVRLLSLHCYYNVLLGYCVIPDWVEEKLQHWEDPIIKVTQRCFLNIVSLLLNRLATSKHLVMFNIRQLILNLHHCNNMHWRVKVWGGRGWYSPHTLYISIHTYAQTIMSPTYWQQSPPHVVLLYYYRFDISRIDGYATSNVPNIRKGLDCSNFFLLHHIITCHSSTDKETNMEVSSLYGQ